MVAYVFPGQGAQYVGMGQNLAENFQVARHVFQEADDTLGFKLSTLCFNGPDDQLQLTENTQPAILTVSVAAWRVLESEGFSSTHSPAYVAGHSLGEYTALVVAGSLKFSTALNLVKSRGLYMQEAVPVGVGAMAAILGVDIDTVKQACEEASENNQELCSPANINSPSQVVIAGHDKAVDRAIELVKAKGAKRAIKLKVSAPFHCDLMKPAQERLSHDLNGCEFRDLMIPLVTNVDASIITTGSEAREALKRQVVAPVRWKESIDLLIEKGIQTFVEVGPGKVLSGLIRQINREAQCLNIEDASSLEASRSKVVSSNTYT
jgi:[acyl-carrier-protein] S-malonyltransferase